MNLFFLWFSVAVFFFMLELLGLSIFLFLPFCLGALITAFLNVWLESTVLQAGCFLGSSIIFLVVLRVLFNPTRFQKSRFTVQLTGKHAVVSKMIVPALTGQVTINGKIFDAQSAHGKILLVGARVIIVEVKNNLVLVQ